MVQNLDHMGLPNWYFSKEHLQIRMVILLAREYENRPIQRLLSQILP